MRERLSERRNQRRKDVQINGGVATIRQLLEAWLIEERRDRTHAAYKLSQYDALIKNVLFGSVEKRSE